MKKFLLLGFLIACAFNSFAFVTQGHWRWRKDDGSETTATWLAAQDAAPVITSGSESIRLRIALYNKQTGASDLNTSTLQCSADAGTTWFNVTTTSTSKAFVIAGSSSNIADQDPTTQQLSGEAGYTFEPGKTVVNSSSVVWHQNVAEKGQTEYEWIIKPTPKMKTNTTYLFKFDPLDDSLSALGGIGHPLTYGAASLTTASVLPITVANFTVKAAGKSVTLEWVTATEQNNDRFEIERSRDAVSWTKILTVKGTGNSDKTNNYKAQDMNPLNGNNYYRLKQYDKDGSFTVSDVRSLKMLLQNSGSVTVFPNPSKGDVNFSLSNYTGSVTATLTDVNGRMVHTEIFKADNAVANYKLNLQKKLHSGMYILQVKGEGLSENIKVMVQ